MFLFSFYLKKKDHFIFGAGGNVRVPRPLLRWSPSCSFCSLLFKTFLTLTTVFFSFFFFFKIDVETLFFWKKLK